MNRSPDRAEVLLQKARDDLSMLEHLAEGPQIPDWGLGFHAQQAVEKAIKAVLSANAVEYPLTHDLARLIQLAEGRVGTGPPDGMELRRLTVFGAALRYDETFREQGVSMDRAWAVSAARRTVVWAEACLRAADQHQEGPT